MNTTGLFSKRTRGALVCLVLLLSACGASTSEPETSNTQSQDLVVTTSTSIAEPAANPPSGETEIPCDNRGISSNYGEKLKLEKCTATWAMGDTDRDSWQCEKEGCPQTRIYQLQGSRWVNTATCQRNLPLTRYASSCYVPNVGVATADLIPPSDVACIIWATNSLPRYAKETGCALNRDVVLASLRETCPDTYDITGIPIEKCDRGEIVRQVQTRLRELDVNVTVSGFYGPESARAIFEFQESKNLIPTAIVDEETWTALGLPK